MYRTISPEAEPFTCDETCADCGRSAVTGDTVLFYRFAQKSLMLCNDCLPHRAHGLLADLMAFTTRTGGLTISRETFTLDVKMQGAVSLSRRGYRRLGDVYDLFAAAHDDEIIISSLGPAYKQRWRAFLNAHEEALRPPSIWCRGHARQ